MARSFKRHVGLSGVYNGDSEFMAGESIMFSGPADKIPAGYLIEDGSAVGRVAYATLFAAIGTTYGAGDGATTFNLPDSRAEVWRGLDLGRGVDVGRVLGSAQGDAMRPLSGSIGLVDQTKALGGLVGAGVFKNGANNLHQVATSGTTDNGWAGGRADLLTLDVSGHSPLANENRMRNLAKIPLIKY